MDRCRPSKHRFAFFQPATLFNLLQIASRRLQNLFENTQVALNHRNGAIETQNSPQLSISWPYKSNSILMHSTSRTGFYSFETIPIGSQSYFRSGLPKSSRRGDQGAVTGKSFTLSIIYLMRKE